MTDQYFDCPVFDLVCPYFDKDKCKCAMAVMGEGNPQEECDSFCDYE